VSRHLFEFRRHVEGVAGEDLAPEPGPVYATQQNDAAGKPVVGENGERTGLSKGFDDKYAGQNGVTGEMPGEEGLFAGEVPAGACALARFNFQDFVYEEEWRPMWQDVFCFEHGC
jgi:hypothetical protein